MLETEELTVEQMREKRYISEAIFKKFTEAKDYFSTHAFCFYEGEDGKYYNSRVETVFGSNYIPHVPGNKREVLKVMKKIQSDQLYDNVCTMFFIDRDYDDSLATLSDDLYETPCYSIENLYAQECVFCRILCSEFGLNITDADYNKCLEDYRLRLSEFNSIILKFNAVVKYQHRYKPDVICNFSNVKTSHLANITIGRVTKAVRHDEYINKLLDQLSADIPPLEEIEKDLSLEKQPCLVYRGKNQLDFMIALIGIFKNLNASGGYFSEKRPRVHINLTENRLSELSQYAITPPELITFLEKHKSQVVGT